MARGLFRHPPPTPRPRWVLPPNPGLTAVRDQFTVADPSPVATPRTADPGPGTADIVDVESVISLLGGRLRGLSQSSPVWGESEVVYSAVARAQGRVYAALVTLEDEVHPIAVGFATQDLIDPRTNGVGWVTTDRDLRVITPGREVVVDDNDRSITTSQYLVVVALNEQGAVIMLSTFGAMGFASLSGDDKVGIPAYPSARVVWVDDSDVSALLYPYVSAYGQGGTTSVNGHAVEDVRVMDVASWSGTDSLATLVDRFTRANSSSAIGNSWTSQNGTWGILNNKVYMVSGSFPTLSYKNSTLADCIVSCDITVPGDWNGSNYGFGLVLRWQDANNYLRLWNDGANTFKLQSWVAGGFGETIFSTGQTWVAGQTYHFSCYMKGSDYLFFLDGVAVGGSTAWTNDPNNRFVTSTRNASQPEPIVALKV